MREKTKIKDPIVTSRSYTQNVDVTMVKNVRFRPHCDVRQRFCDVIVAAVPRRRMRQFENEEYFGFYPDFVRYVLQ